MFIIRPAIPSDASTWLRLRCELWPDGSADHPQEIASYFAGTAIEPYAVFHAESESSRKCVAILELSIRTDLPNLTNQKVGYIEGLYITPAHRGTELSRLLLRTAQSWAREQRCIVFASDRPGRIILDPHYSL